MGYQYERLPDESGRALAKYQIVDKDRDLRLEQKARVQNSFRFWFWRGSSCYEIFVETHPYLPGTHNVPVEVMATQLRERATGVVASGQELQDLRSLVPEAVEAFTRLSSPRDRIDRVIVKTKF